MYGALISHCLPRDYATGKVAQLHFRALGVFEDSLGFAAEAFAKHIVQKRMESHHDQKARRVCFRHQPP